jgi:hypothetical protein
MAYITLSEANTVLSKNPYVNESWDELSDTEKQNLIDWAYNLFETSLNWIGEKVSDVQTNQFPRNYDSYLENDYYLDQLRSPEYQELFRDSNGVIPDQVKQAQYAILEDYFESGAYRSLKLANAQNTPITQVDVLGFDHRTGLIEYPLPKAAWELVQIWHDAFWYAENANIKLQRGGVYADWGD